MAALKPGRYVFNPQNIEAVRKKLGLTQQELANKLGVAKTAISRWEQGKVTPDADSLAAIYSQAKEGRIEPNFFKKMETTMKQGRSNLIVSWDYQNVPVSQYEASEKSKYIKDELIKRFPSVSHSISKIFASPMYSIATNEMSKQGWRIQEFEYDIDEELDTQSWSDCNQAPNDTIFVLITRDGDFVDLIEELRKKGVRVYLMAPENCSQQLIEAVGRKKWIRFPA